MANIRKRLFRCYGYGRHALVSIASAEKDNATQDFLWGFVREQVEEEATAQGIVDKLKKAGDTGLLFIDAQLAKR